MIRVVDTNVLVLADEGAAHENPKCALVAIRYLADTIKNGRTGLDAGGLILKEYRGRARKHIQPGVGHAFLVHLYENQHFPQHAKRVEITEHHERGFAEFPDDPLLAAFDMNDRKFVAVALVCGQEHEIANAVDSDWRDFQSSLENCGVVIRMLCDES